MANEQIQPSNDHRATAMVIAAQIYTFMEFDDSGSQPKGLEAKKKAAAERIKLISAAVKELCESVMQSP